MKITVLAGSPHRNGTTSVLVKAFTEGAEEAGISTRVWAAITAGSMEASASTGIT